MPITNLNKKMLDRPAWEQLSPCLATGIAGTCIESDGNRFIYYLAQTSTTASSFYRYDTWNDTHQQLATPPTQTGTINNMSYFENMGGQFNGRTYGALYLFNGNGTTAYLYKYDIATNAWTTLNATNVPATFATDCYLLSLSPSKKNWEGSYHSGVLRTITISAGVSVGATSISVSALPEALAAGTRLRFGTFAITLTSGVLKGDTTIACSALPQGLAADTALILDNGEELFVKTAVASGATSITIYPAQIAVTSGTIITIEQFVVLTAAAAASATSITVSPALYTISNASTALYYGQMYLIGNNATVMYRYNIGTAVWATTSANSGTPAIPAVSGSCGTGCALKWLPAYNADKLFIVRGNATANIYTYDLVANTMATLTISPATETFTTGSSVSVRTVAGKAKRFMIHKENTGRIYEFNPVKGRIDPKITQWITPSSTAVVGDKSCCITSPDGVEYFFTIPNSTNSLVRCGLLDI